MPARTWVGGNTAVAQIETWTVGGSWSTAETITTTLTAEDGTTQAVVTTIADATPTVEEVRDEHLVDLLASTDTLFLRITFAASSTDEITATANDAGVPFYSALTEGSAAGTYAEATTQAVAGPNLWTDTGNWLDSTVPVTGDTVWINQGTYSILYGLDQSAVDLAELHITKNYRGTSIGDKESGYYLQIDVANGTAATNIHSVNCQSVWLKGSHDEILITGTSRDANAVQLSGGTLTAVATSGPDVGGTITISDATVGSLVVAGCPGATHVMQSSIASAPAIDCTNFGTIDDHVGCAVSNAAGGSIINDSDVFNLTSIWSGSYDYRGADTAFATLTQYGGTILLSRHTSEGFTITTFNQYDGDLDIRGGPRALTITNYNQEGTGTITPDAGQTVSIS